MIKNIDSYKSLIENISKTGKSFLLLYKSGSEISECAYKNIKQLANDNKNANILIADVNSVRDIHKNYNITSVPTLVSFENNKLINVTKGCNDYKIYKSLINNNLYSVSTDNNEKPKKRVTVYSTPTCTYCNQIKRYFDEKGIKYRDIDVSRDQKAAEQMVKRSGQQGVPQTDINGQIVIGFDRMKINKLLGIE